MLSRAGPAMILEIMQHHYLMQSMPELNRRIAKFVELAQNNDSETLEILRKSKVETSEIKKALDCLKEAEAALAKTSGGDPAFFVQNPQISQTQSILQRYFITNKLI